MHDAGIHEHLLELGNFKEVEKYVCLRQLDENNVTIGGVCNSDVLLLCLSINK